MPKLTKDEAAELRGVARALMLAARYEGHNPTASASRQRSQARAAFERRLAELTEG